MTTSKRVESLGKKLRRFYEENPDEWLSVNDMEAKFSKARGSCITALSELLKEGVIERVSIYRRTAQVKGTSE